MVEGLIEKRKPRKFMSRKMTGWLLALVLGPFAGQQVHAFYNPTAGRWLNRDPIGIRGGLNIYGFAHNETLAKFDPDGRAAQTVKCGGVCGAIADDWFLDEITAQIRGWDQWKRDNTKAGTIDEYIPWANGNQRYKDDNHFKFNTGTGCGTADTPHIKGSGCGFSVTLCGNCVRSSILGNLVYGIVGRYAGFTDAQLNQASAWKQSVGMTVDPYDEVAYSAGGEIYGSGFEGIYDVQNVCQEMNNVLKKHPTALREGRADGGFNDLSSCRPCTKKTPETRHGGNKSPSRIP